MNDLNEQIYITVEIVPIPIVLNKQCQISIDYEYVFTRKHYQWLLSKSDLAFTYTNTILISKSPNSLKMNRKNLKESSSDQITIAKLICNLSSRKVLDNILHTHNNNTNAAP